LEHLPLAARAADQSIPKGKTTARDRRIHCRASGAGRSRRGGRFESRL